MVNLAHLAVLAAETGHEGEGVNAWGVGIVTLGILMILLLVIVAIGGGREHT